MTASSGPIAAAISSKGAGSFPVLFVGFSSVMEDKPANCFSFLLPGSDPKCWCFLGHSPLTDNLTISSNALHNSTYEFLDVHALRPT
jgi:hypothetical protein